MSLVGSLEDLGLGDILQIITLSRKSGSLNLRSEEGEGRVIFRDGLVCGGRVKGQTPDLRGLVVGADVLSDAEFESVRGDAAELGITLSQALSEKVTSDRFEVLRRECVERAVLAMFAWDTGEFSFEVGDDGPEDEFEVMLDAGINAQYLAMEGTRRTDEQVLEPEAASDELASFADVAKEIAADETDPRPADATDAGSLASVERVDGDGERDGTADEVVEALEAALVPEAPPRPPGDPAHRPPVVVLDADLPVLEWVKGALEGTFRRIHIFQRAELAVERLRQYLARGQAPLVLVSPSLPLDRSHGWRDVEDLVARMKKQSPRSRVLWLGPREASAPADGSVPRANLQEIGRSPGPEAKLAHDVRAGLLSALGEDPTTAGPMPEEAPAESPRLAAVIARLEDPETRGEVLNAVLEFAAEHFERVALFAVRGGEAQGLAGIGLEKAGGPDDVTLRGVKLGTSKARWLARAIDSRGAARGSAEGGGDQELAAHLGEAIAPEAWLAPVISRDEVVAVLYGDNLPGCQPLPATDELEAATVRAGLVLDEALAQRTRSAR